MMRLLLGCQFFVCMSVCLFLTATGAAVEPPAAVFLATDPSVTLSCSGVTVDVNRLLETKEFDSVAFSADGSTLAVGRGPAFVQLWDVPTRAPKFVLQGLAGEARALAFSPDGKLLATASKTETVIWNLATQMRKSTITWKAKYPLVKFSPDGASLILGAEVSDKGYRMPVWDLKSESWVKGREINLSGQAVAFSPDGKKLVVGSATDGEHGVLRDVGRGAHGMVQVFNWPEIGKAQATLILYSAVVDLAFSADGKQVISGHAHQWIGTLPVSGGHGNHRSLVKNFEPVKWLALSPTGTRAAMVTTEGLQLWDVAQAKRLRTIPGIDGPVAFTPDGRQLIAGKQSELEWYDAADLR